MLEILNTESFKQKVFNYTESTEWKFGGDLPCLVDFYADWCTPCKMIAPTLETLAKEYEGKLNIYKVNTDHEPEVASAFGINSIPSLLFVPKEGQPQMAMGAMTKSALEKVFKDVLKVE